MRCTHSIYIELLHKAYVLQHPFRRNHIPPVRINLMAVRPFEKNRLAIDQHLTVGKLDLAESYFQGYDLSPLFD